MPSIFINIKHRIKLYSRILREGHLRGVIHSAFLHMKLCYYPMLLIISWISYAASFLHVHWIGLLNKTKQTQPTKKKQQTPQSITALSLKNPNPKQPKPVWWIDILFFTAYSRAALIAEKDKCCFLFLFFFTSWICHQIIYWDTFKEPRCSKNISWKWLSLFRSEVIVVRDSVFSNNYCAAVWRGWLLLQVLRLTGRHLADYIPSNIKIRFWSSCHQAQVVLNFLGSN